jgi:hypothetical protein
VVGIAVEQLDLAAGDSHVDHTHADALRQPRYQGAPEVIGRAQAGGTAAQRRGRWIPLALFAAQVGEVYGSQHLEPRVDAGLVLGFDTGKPFHVGLAECQVDMKVQLDSRGLLAAECPRSRPEHCGARGGSGDQEAAARNQTRHGWLSTHTGIALQCEVLRTSSST